MAPAPAVVKKQEAKKVINPLFEKRPKNFGIGKLNENGSVPDEKWQFIGQKVTLRISGFGV